MVVLFITGKRKKKNKHEKQKFVLEQSHIAFFFSNLVFNSCYSMVKKKKVWENFKLAASNNFVSSSET